MDASAAGLMPGGLHFNNLNTFNHYGMALIEYGKAVTWCWRMIRHEQQAHLRGS